MRFVTSILLLLATLAWGAQSARILGVFPFPGKSHMNVNRALVVELARRGHEVTIISCFPLEKPIPNYKDIVIPDYSDIFQGHLAENATKYDIANTTIVSMLKMMAIAFTEMEDQLLSGKPITDLLNSEEKFDLVIYEEMFMNTFMAFAHRFDTPLVLISSNIVSSLISRMVGNPHTYSYTPDLLIGDSDKMNFFERMSNFLAGSAMHLMKIFLYNPRQNRLLEKYFSDEKGVPTIGELEKRIALVIGNSHFSVNYPRPNLPNVIEAGGLHIKETKPLPKDLQSFLDSSPEGVILFSMGSHIPGSDMPEHMKKAALEVFPQLKQKILWKWEKDFPDKPSNVMVKKWLPQNDILAHPNVIAFMSHGGLLSTEESIYHGIPVVCIPVFGDQVINSYKAMKRGYGIQLKIENITPDTLSWALNEVIHNPSYRETAKNLSKTFRDRPEHPLQTAAFWTEYVIRHKGAPHMRSAALDLTWYQYFLLDVIAFLLIVPILVIYVAYRVLRKAIFLYSSRKTSEKVKKH